MLTHYTTLYYIMLRYATLCFSILYTTILYHSILCCATLYYDVLHYKGLHYIRKSCNEDFKVKHCIEDISCYDQHFSHLFLTHVFQVLSVSQFASEPGAGIYCRQTPSRRLEILLVWKHEYLIVWILKRTNIADQTVLQYITDVAQTLPWCGS